MRATIELPTFARGAARCLTVSVMCLASVAPGRASAQDRPRLGVLEIPTGQTMRCRAVPVGTSTLRPEALRLEFVLGDGPRNERRITVAYDSAGQPLELAETVVETTDDGEVVGSGVTAAFGPEGGGGVRMRFGMDAAMALVATDSAGRERLAPKIVPRLTDAEVAKARAVAEWLYARRCDGRAPKREAPPERRGSGGAVGLDGQGGIRTPD